MCKITDKYTDSDTFTGYKVVVKIDGKYYSPATGIEYKPGKVTIPRKIDSEFARGFGDDILDKETSYYCKKLIGKTGVFVDLNDARMLHPWIDHSIVVEMTISGDLVNGEAPSSPFTHCNIIAGNNIVSMEEVYYG